LSYIALLGVEFLDEFIYGLQGAILPKLRDDLALTYTQVGLLFTIPGLISIAGEPVIGLIGDTRYRRPLILGGIAVTALGLFLTGIGQTFAIILIAFTVLYIASGAYVNLTQATLIDRNPPRAERTMAIWTFIGSVAAAVAPLIVTALFLLEQNWRLMYVALAVVAAVYIAILARQRFDAHAGAERHSISPSELARDLMDGLRNRELLRWVIVTELADLMLDKLLEVTGLYFHDVVGVDIAEASGAVAIFTIAGLVGNALLVPALEKIRGARILRVSAVVTLALYVAFLLIPVGWLKFILIALISFSTSGWFAILRANTYAVMPGQSGLIVSVTSLGNISSVFVPAILGGMADLFGLQWAMWLLALGPVALLVGLPKDQATGVAKQ
jgi:MFS transporter, FSR family, fosmidomycin resistance protein